MIKQFSPNELLSWYDRNRRHLPWREDPTPYHVWLSEIMLQQTRVEAVKDYYTRFLREFPDIHSLSSASEDRVLKQWEGLGYYSRARNLKRAAETIETEYDGKMPCSAIELRKLPGIGDYTSAAIASIAFGEKQPAIDGNLLRIFARLTVYRENIQDIKAKQEAYRFFHEVMEKVPEEELREDGRSVRFGDLNQALMDLGATICLPNASPLCEKCPLNESCLVHRSLPGEEQDLPVILKKKPRRIENRTIFILQDEECTILRKRPKKGLLAGLYEFPNTEGHLTEEEAIAYVRSMGFEPLRIRPLGAAKHIFSHIEWHMQGYKVRVDELQKMDYDAEDHGHKFLLADTASIRNTYSIPTAFRYYRDRVEGPDGDN